MGIFDSIMKAAGDVLQQEPAKQETTTDSQVGKGKNYTETFTFSALPNNLSELQAMPEASLDSAFKTTALTIAVLCSYEKNPMPALKCLIS